MADRNYQCAICHKLFRKETGMQSHLVRSHETPAAMEVMRQDYEAKGKTTEASLYDVTGQLDDAKARIYFLNNELQRSKNANLSLQEDIIKSEAETERYKHDYKTLILAVGLAFPAKPIGNVPNTMGASGAAAVSVGTLKANGDDPLVPPAVSSAPTVPPYGLLKSGMIRPPVYDPEYLESVRATFGYGSKYCPTKLQNQSAGPVTGSK